MPLALGLMTPNVRFTTLCFLLSFGSCFILFHCFVGPLVSHTYFFFLKTLFIHRDTHRERERERKAETQAEGEAGSMQGA